MMNWIQGREGVVVEKVEEDVKKEANDNAEVSEGGIRSKEEVVQCQCRWEILNHHGLPLLLLLPFSPVWLQLKGLILTKV